MRRSRSNMRQLRPLSLLTLVCLAMLFASAHGGRPDYVSLPRGSPDMTLEDYVYCTFFGGSSNDRITGVAVTHGGEIVVVGGTFSTDLPVLNAYQENYAGGEVPEHLFVMGDAFVAKISEGGHLLWCTYLGGSGLEEPSCVAIDDEGNIIVIGLTRSDDFPVTGDAMQTVFGQGESDGFISVFDLDGALLHSTYIGGSGSENLRVFGIDAMGNFVLVGRTASADYPVTPDALQLELKGESDCFITVVSRDLSTVLYSTLLGGGSTDAGNEIAIDGEGTVIISGSTSSLDFPVTDDALQDTITGEERDCFLAKFSDSWELLYATFFGGSHMDDCFGLAIDASNNIHIVGRTWSPDFPVTPDAMQVSYSQESFNENAVDSIYSKISADGRTLLYSTYLGYDGWDSFLNVGFDSEGNVVLSGLADSGGFPVVRAFQEDQAGYADVFLMVLSPSGELLLSSYLGGMSFEHPSGQALVGGALVLVGNTHSTDFPVTEDALQRGMRGYQDGFVFKIDLAGYRRSAEEIRASGSRLRTYATVVPYAVVVGSIALWFVVMRRYFGSG